MEIESWKLEEIYRKNLSFEERQKIYDEYDPESQDNYGRTLFHFAVKYADSEIFEYLFIKEKLLGKTKIFKNDSYGNSPLFMINDIKNPHEKYEEIKKIIKIFAESGVNFQKRDDRGNTFYHICADYQKYTIFEILNELGIKYDKVIMSNGWNVLHIACAALSRIDYYLKDEKKYAEEEIPFLRTIKAIISSGIDVDTKTAIGKTAYEIAFETKNKRACAMLKNVSEDDKTYGIGIHEACWFGYEDIVKEHIKKGTDLNEIYEGNIKDLQKLSPLAVSVKHLHKNITEILIENGADILLKDGETGRSAFYYFAKTMMTEKINIKGSKKAENFSDITSLFLSDEKFLNDFADDELHTPVNLICSISNRFNWTDENKMAEFIIFENLIDEGADVNIPDKYGNTPLHNLFSNGGEKIGEMTELILENGGDPDSKNILGETPLMCLAKIWREEEALTALEILENYNPNLSLTDNKGDTALMTAVKSKKEKLAEYLLKMGG